MAVRELTCISCPLGCPLKVELEDVITYNLGHGEVITNND